MSRPIWFVELLKKTFSQRFFFARMTRVRWLGGFIDKWLFEGDRILYLAKDKSILVNKPLDAPKEIVLPSRVVDHFIEKANYHWIMDSCICRDASKCKDYPTGLGCLFLGEAALGINPKLGRRVTKEEAFEHVRRCRDAGLVHLIGRNKLDAVWLGVEPGDKLLTICNCCPCCCIWRVIPDLAPSISAKVSKMPGVTVRVTDDCEGCGTCAQDVCFAKAIRLDDAAGRAVISDECRGCGRCSAVCPHEAIEISIENEQFIKDSIDRISPLVDIT